MERLRILSWNVNGLRAVHRKGFLDWFAVERPDILCIQETKAREEQLPGELAAIDGYRLHMASAEKKGYSGVAMYSNREPKSMDTGFGIDRFDREGRIQIADFGRFVLFNIYFPNGQQSDERLAYKMAFYDAFLGRVDKFVRDGRHVVVTGDFNTAHREIDLARPKENETVSGFLPEERAWMDTFVDHGYVDTFRAFHDGPDHYTWWSYRSRARERNVGWRLDYFFVDEAFIERVGDSFILSGAEGSDHCPVGIEIIL